MKKVKKIAAICISCCMLLTSAVFAAETDEKDEVSAVTAGSGIVPYSTYYKTGTISISRSSGSVTVTVSTYAYQTVSHIYHDVTVYINGNWYSSERYENWNKISLSNSFSVPASSGDYIDVYADHYTENNGLTEVGHSHTAITY